MAAKIFLTGATGYIGGETLVDLLQTHPDYEYTLLVRDAGRADVVRAGFAPAVAARLRFVYGTLDSADVLAAAAPAADVVVHAGNSADHVAAVEALVAGIVAGHTAAKPGVLVHVSGAGVLAWYDIVNGRSGEPVHPDEIYNDLGGVERLVTGIAAGAPHRNVDARVQALAAAHPDVLRTAIVSPPLIYGIGRGPGNRRSLQLPAMTSFLLTHGYAPRIGAGAASWDVTHVRDVAALLRRLAEAGLDAAERRSTGTPTSIFGPHAYYLTSSGEVLTWGDAAAKLAAEAQRQGFVAPGDATTAAAAAALVRTVAVADVVAPDAPDFLIYFTWGLNARGTAERARTLLGWAPQGEPVEAFYPAQVAVEAERLGLKAAAKQ